jgi:sugar lactone lactonase YvrE
MKRVNFRSRTGLARGWNLLKTRGLLLAVCLGTGLGASATVVTTLGGGPGGANGSRPWGNTDGNSVQMALFNYPSGLALDPQGKLLYIADYTNNSVRAMFSLGDLANGETMTFAGSGYGISRPVAVVLDPATNLYVLNRGTGNNGTILKFDASAYSQYYDRTLVSTNATLLTNATAMAIDALTNLYVTVQSNRVVRISPSGAKAVVGVITNSGTWLKGIAVLDNGTLALSDAGNHGIWKMDPASGAAVQFTGFHGIGDSNTVAAYAQFHGPEMLAKAGDGKLVVADRYNNKVKIINPDGRVVRLYGVNSNYWTATYKGYYDGTVNDKLESSSPEEARQPVGVAVGGDGTVYTSEAFYHIIRQAAGCTNLTGSTNLGCPPLYSAPQTVALNAAGTQLYVADATNGAVYALNLTDNSTSPFIAGDSRVTNPVGLLVDSSDYVYVLNQGSGSNGTILKYDSLGGLDATNASGLSLPSGFLRDSAGNFLLCEAGGKIKQVSGGVVSTIATVTNAGVELRGIALFDDGTIAVSDYAHHVLWQVDPVTRSVSWLSGKYGVSGANAVINPTNALFNQPGQLARAAGNALVASDSGNSRLVVIGRSGSVSNVLNSTNSLIWFGRASDPHGSNDTLYLPMLRPEGLLVGASGNVFVAEPANHVVRKVMNSGLTQYVGAGSSTSTNSMDAPVIYPSSGYYPMGQVITVTSPYADVYYTMDGSVPDTNSASTHKLSLSGNAGYIQWHNTTNTLRALCVKAFSGTNSSAVVAGGYPASNSIGIPSPLNADRAMYGGVGSKIVVPVVVNLRSNVVLRTYQFRVEITPNGTAPQVSGDFQVLSIQTNDFIPVITPSGTSGTNYVGYEAYTNGATVGLKIFCVGDWAANKVTESAVLAMLEVPISWDAAQGQTYSISVTNASGTAEDGVTSVSLPAMAPASILVTNIPYLVGDTASASGAWYNAGSLGDGILNAADVNNAFYAASGLRSPYAFSDAFNAMDAYSAQTGDGILRIEDWMIILNRSLGLDKVNWIRQWNDYGDLVGTPTTNLIVTMSLQSVLAKAVAPASPWYRQATLAASSVGGAAPGSQVAVPLYVKTADGCPLSCLQFRALVLPENGAPAIADSASPSLSLASGVPSVLFAKSFKPGEAAYAWNLNTLNFGAHSSNFLGWVRFTVPASAQAGQSYRVCLTNVGGLQTLSSGYTLESRGAVVSVLGAAPADSLTSDDWKQHFFGSTTAAAAADLADADGDGVPNWMEYLAGTDPLSASSRLAFQTASREVASGKPQFSLSWLSAQGKAYEVQWSTNLSAGPWTTLSSVSGDGTVITCVDTNVAGSARFYRVHLVQ